MSQIYRLKTEINFYPDVIFLNGVIHHFDDYKINILKNFIKNNFPKSIFLSADPVLFDNNFINSLMLKFDRGRFIRTLKSYKYLMKNYSFIISDLFFRVNFKLIFHYKNINLKILYNLWKNKIVI